MSSENISTTNSKEPGLKSTEIKQEDDKLDEGKSVASSDDEEDCTEKVPFPVILHGIVCDPETDNCIHWLPNGNLFTISDKKKFAREVMPKLNGQAKFTSFTRRLKRWGFSRIASGPQIGAYQNPDFTKDDPERLKNIKYMHQKPLSVAAIQKQHAKLQAAKANMDGVGSAVSAPPPTQDLIMLQALLSQQQSGLQMAGHASNPAMQGYNALKTHDVAASSNNNNLAIQLAMLQAMQNQHQRQQIPAAPVAAAAVSSSVETPKNESFGEMIVRTNPSLAAQLIEAKNINGMMSLQGMANNAPNPIMAMFAAQNPSANQMQQQAMNPALVQQMQSNLFALLQQDQQQKQLQQQQEFIKSFMSGQMNQQSQAPASNKAAHRESCSDSSLLVTPSSSAPSLHRHNHMETRGVQADENWLSALLSRNNAGNSTQANSKTQNPNPKESGDRDNM
jgi:hypothetical protein